MKVEIVIPHRDNDGTDNADVIKNAIKHLCSAFGGGTVLHGEGHWVAPDGQLYVGPVAVITSTATDREQARAEMVSLAKRVMAFTDQKAVFISIDGDGDIVE